MNDSINSLLLSSRFYLDLELLLEPFSSNDFLDDESAIFLSLSLRLLSKFDTIALTLSNSTFIFSDYYAKTALCFVLSSFRHVVNLSQLDLPLNMLSFLLQKSSESTALSLRIEVLTVVRALYIGLSSCFVRLVLTSTTWLLSCNFLYYSRTL